MTEEQACLARVPNRTMDVDDTGAMLNTWKFEDKSKLLIFHMEKCVGCDLCRILCPTSCIELGPVPEIANGTLQKVPPILVNHETCAYCGLCAAICPTQAFEFSTDPADFIVNAELPHFFFSDFVKFVQERMKRSFDHPASSYIELPESLKKPTEGKVILRGDRLALCDPMGCKGCLQICPTGCFWVPKKAEDITSRGKITMDEDFCIHCAACHNACPHRIIEVQRTRVEHEMPTDGTKPWQRAWENRINRLIGTSAAPRRETPLVVAESAQEKTVETEHSEQIKEIPAEIKRQLLKNFDRVKASLGQVNMRYWIEFKKLESLRKSLESLFPSAK
jgi:4Fe-4S ferredoxin